MASKMFSKAPWASSSHEGKEQEPEDDGQSLTTVLQTPEDRSDLNRLIIDCTETMRMALCETFDPLQTGSIAEEFPAIKSQKKSDLVDPLGDLDSEDIDAIDQAKQDREKRIKELAAPKMQDLKRAALKHFDEWREGVILRVGEVINDTKAKTKAKPARTDTQRPSKPTKTELEHDLKPSGSESQPQTPASPSTIFRKVATDSRAEGVTDALNELYPAHDTELMHLPESSRILIMHSLLLLLLSLEHYMAQSRVLLLYITSSLHLPVETLTDDERKVARGLLEAAKTQMTADAETKKKAQQNATSRRWKVGLGAAAGATILAVTGGLAAPLLAAGIGSVMGGLGLGATAAAGYLGSLAGSVVLVGGLFGAYGGRMTSKVIDQYAREVEDFAFLPINEFSEPPKTAKESRRLRVAIGISGWLTSEEEIVKPWHIIAGGIEGFALRWEFEALISLGNGLTTLITSAAWGLASREIIAHTVFAGLSVAFWPLIIVKASRIIDNPFSVARFRSEKAGEVLAEALINKVQGERPVTLIGYSLGARVIYSCLQTLADRNAFGLIESVVLVGAPTPSDSLNWRRMRAVVPGRVINVFSTNDYILRFLYRTSSLQNGIAGLQPVTGIKNIENVDVSDIVDGHLKYQYLVGSILKKIGFEDIDREAVEADERELKEVQRKEEEARKLKEAKHKSDEDLEDEVEEMEKEVRQKNEASSVGWMSRKMAMLKFGKESEGELTEKEKLANAEHNRDRSDWMD